MEYPPSVRWTRCQSCFEPFTYEEARMGMPTHIVCPMRPDPVHITPSTPPFLIGLVVLIFVAELVLAGVVGWKILSP